MKLLIVYARFINVRVFNKTPSILVTKGFDDFVTVGYLLTETLLIIALCQCRDRDFGVRRGRRN